MEQGRLGVLSSHEAYLFHFKEMTPSSEQQDSIDEVEAEEDVKLHLVYVWIGREAGVEACTAARAQVGLRATCSLVDRGRWICRNRAGEEKIFDQI